MFIYFSVLPPPIQTVWDRDEERAKAGAIRPASALVTALPTAPPYGSRAGWVPRTVEASTYKHHESLCPGFKNNFYV